MTTPTTTETEDIGTRLAVVETEVRNINTRLDDTNSLLARMHTEQQAENRAMRAELQESRREQQAENRAMRAELQAELRAVNDRIDQLGAQTNDRLDRLGARIERLFWAIVGIGAGIIITLVGGFIGLILQL